MIGEYSSITNSAFFSSLRPLLHFSQPEQQSKSIVDTVLGKIDKHPQVLEHPNYLLRQEM